jgi:hypothetical protein
MIESRNLIWWSNSCIISIPLVSSLRYRRSSRSIEDGNGRLEGNDPKSGTGCWYHVLPSIPNCNLGPAKSPSSWPRSCSKESFGSKCLHSRLGVSAVWSLNALVCAFIYSNPCNIMAILITITILSFGWVASNPTWPVRLSWWKWQQNDPKVHSMMIKMRLNSLNNAITPDFHMIISNNCEILANLLCGISHQQRTSNLEGRIYLQKPRGFEEISVKRGQLCARYVKESMAWFVSSIKIIY